jgi:hypothetical protein
LDWTPAFAGETNLGHGSFSSFRRKPESSRIKDEIRYPYNYDLISNSSKLEVLKKGTNGLMYILFLKASRVFLRTHDSELRT